MFGPAAGLWVEATIVNTQTGNNTTKHYLGDGSEGRKSIKADENKSFLSYSKKTHSLSVHYTCTAVGTFLFDPVDRSLVS